MNTNTALSQNPSVSTAHPTPEACPACTAPPPLALLTPEDLALRLGISRRSLANWTRKKILPMIKIGRVCRFDPASVRVALEQYEQKVTGWRAEGIDASRYYDGVCPHGALQSFLSHSAATATRTR